uniref:(northern house mosquito) hypothetical protein n=1 Tax=Culex pipiens TaxID=7175 RepID=A0A8D8P565_CULPI
MHLFVSVSNSFQVHVHAISVYHKFNHACFLTSMLLNSKRLLIAKYAPQNSYPLSRSYYFSSTEQKKTRNIQSKPFWTNKNSNFSLSKFNKNIGKVIYACITSNSKTIQ